jgi:hypothetical protein
VEYAEKRGHWTRTFLMFIKHCCDYAIGNLRKPHQSLLCQLLPHNAPPLPTPSPPRHASPPQCSAPSPPHLATPRHASSPQCSAPSPPRLAPLPAVLLTYLSYNDTFLMFYIIIMRRVGALFLRRWQPGRWMGGGALRERSWHNKD